jgi:hypothetical protein
VGANGFGKGLEIEAGIPLWLRSPLMGFCSFDGIFAHHIAPIPSLSCLSSLSLKSITL